MLSRVRRREARVLMDAGLPAGSYYLAGYAVECALKAGIASSVQQFDFPDKAFANNCFTHDLSQLMKLAGLEKTFDADAQASPALARNWAIVKDWRETIRYERTIEMKTARAMYRAITARRVGVLAWLRQHW